MDVYPDFEEFLKLLRDNKVEFLVIGGYAVAYHSRPKYTKDIDIWIKNSKTNAVKLIKTLQQFGFNHSKFAVADFLSEFTVVQVGYLPVRIDIMTGLEGLNFKDAYQNRVYGKYGSIENVPYISYDDLIKNKELTGREYDEQDIKWLRKYKKKSK